MRALSLTLTRLRRDDSGATLVEFAIVMGIFLFLLFGLIDFARLGLTNVMAEKATETAVRTAVVSPAVCSGLPSVNRRGTAGLLALDMPNGTRCSARSGLCVAPQPVTCLGNASQAQASLIWDRVAPLMPGNATIANLRFTYSYDANLNRVGARYAPIVTVEIVNLDFEFISPLGALAAFAGSTEGTDLGQTYSFPAMSASLPAEDLG